MMINTRPLSTPPTIAPTFTVSPVAGLAVDTAAAAIHYQVKYHGVKYHRLLF